MKLRPLRRPPARSLYFRLLQLGLALVLLPSLLIAIAWIYEHFASRAQMERLARVPSLIHAGDIHSWEQVAPREGVVIALLDIARGDDAVVTDRTVDTFIKRLRKKIRDVDGAFDEIETVFGVGYRYRD